MTRLAVLFLAGSLLAGCPDSGVPCAVARDCPSTQRCVNGGCVDPGLASSALGEACRTTADCGSGLTCDTDAQGFPGGFCTATCTSSAGCIASACTPVAGLSVCMPACTADSQCRQGYGCCATLGNVCTPLAACTPAQCTRPVVASALPPAQVQDFGTHKVNDEIPFNVPAGTGSFTIVQQARLATLTITFQNTLQDNSAVPLTITRPDGTVVYDDRISVNDSSPDGGTDPSGHYAFFGGSSPSTGAFTIPNTSASLDAGVPSGTWKFKVNDYAYECTILSGCNDGGTTENTYDVSVVTTPGPGTTMDVAFYIVTDAFSEANAGTDPSVQRMVQTFKGIYAQAGITVNPVFHDVSATDKARFGTNISATTTGPCDDLSQMFTLSSAHPGNTMNLFLVQSLRDASGGGGGTVVGIDGTIPGPASYNGTVQSGAVVSAADLFALTSGCGGGVNIGGCGADRVAYIAAHETGHFLGLFHTTESSGSDFDPLVDTPKCPCLSCASPTDLPNCTSTSNPPFISASRCLGTPPGCGGGNNLMFWFLQTGASAGALSAEQIRVMRLSPLVH
ncbi:MAG TPA: hypothetical protein VFA79_04610 [Myxococcales bacterium]|nr:hypothetical protein [Myxococcales bacterium]